MREKTERDWQAQWIWWAQSDGPSAYQHVTFRKEFDLAVVPRAALCFLAADTYYRLCINGQFIMHGAARTAEGEAVYDELHVAPLLRIGSNVITVEVMFVGVDVFDALPQSPGLLLELQISEAGLVICTDGTWRTAPASPYVREAPRFSVQRGFVEIVDARLQDYGDREWPAAAVIGPVGTPPWRKVAPRGTPLPATDVIRPKKVRELTCCDGTAYGDVVKGSREELWWENPERWYGDVAFYRGDLPAILHTERPSCFDGELDGDLGELCTGGSRAVTVTPGKHDPAVTFDFGQNEAGFVTFDISAEEGTIVDVVWAERPFTDGHIRPRMMTTNSFLRYIARSGRQRFEAFHPQTMRFCKIILRTGGEAVTLHEVGLRRHYYDDRGACAFACSDAMIQNIYDAARQTLLLNTTDMFMDCPSRERGAWFHDGYWTALAGHYLLGENRVNRRMLRIGAKTQGFNGDMPGLVGSCVGGRHGDRCGFYMGHVLFFVLQIEMEPRLSGRDDLAEELAACVQRLMSQVNRWRNERGLLEDTPGTMFLDYSAISALSGTCAGVAMNALYAAALDAAARVTGDQAYTEQAAETRVALNELAWDAGSAVCADCLVREEGRLVRGPEACETTQYFALWAGVPGPERAAALWQSLRNAYDGPYSREAPILDGRLTRANLYSFFQRAESGFRFGEHERILRDIKNCFGPMTVEPPNTLWEVFDPGMGMSYCHGIASAVGAILVRDYLGIRPGARGFTDAVVEPHPGGMRWARGFVTTEQGRLSVSWLSDPGRFELEVVPVSGGTATLRLPAEALENISAGSAPAELKIAGPARVVAGPGFELEELARTGDVC